MTRCSLLIVSRIYFPTRIRFFLEQTFDNEYDRECVRMLWTYLVPKEFCIFICKNDSFIVLNKLSLKYQNGSEIVNDFIVENNKHFLRLKEYFKRNALISHYIYALSSPKYFCRVDDYSVRSKLAFDVAYGGYKNQQENIHFIREMPIKAHCHHLLLLHSSRIKKRKEMCECDIVVKIAWKKKKREEKKATLLCKLETNGLHMKHINSKVCKNNFNNHEFKNTVHTLSYPEDAGWISSEILFLLNKVLFFKEMNLLVILFLVRLYALN